MAGVLPGSKRSIHIITTLAILAGSVAAVAGNPVAAHAEPSPTGIRYTVTDIGTFGGELSNAFGVNDRGAVVGRAETPSQAVKGFLWREGKLIDIGSLNRFGTGTTAYGLNNRGEIVGSSMAPDPQFGSHTSVPFFHSETPQPVDPFTMRGTIDNPGPLGTSVTQSEFLAGCPDLPASQGLDAYVFELPGFIVEGTVATLTATNSSGSYDLTASIWFEGCHFDEHVAEPGSDVTHVLQADTKYIAVTTATGHDSTVTLTVAPPEQKMINVGADYSYSGTGAARDVNDHDVVVGVWRHHPFTWNPRDGYSELDLLPGAYFDQAEVMAVNNRGVSVGWGTDAEAFDKPTRWQPDGTVEQLPVLPGGRYGVANDVNLHGQTAGEADTLIGNGRYVRPVTWDADGTIEEIPLLSADPPLNVGFAEGINDHGVVIGWDMSSVRGDGRKFGWVRDTQGVKIRLNDLINSQSGWEIGIPLDVNSHGQIVGIGTLVKDSVEYSGRAFLLTPVVTLAGDAYKFRGDWYAGLTWATMGTGRIDVFRDGRLVTTTDNDGGYADRLGKPAKATMFRYRICLSATTICSDAINVTM